MALMSFGFGFYLLTHKQHLKVLLTPWPWVGILIATVMCLPIFIWNVQYDWPGFKYQFHDRHADGGFDLNRWLGFLGTQVAVLSPGLLALVFYSAYQSAKRFSTISFRFALSVFIPSFLIFYFQPLFADYKPHWMGPVYLLMIMMGCGLIYNSRGWKIAVFAFLIPLNILVYSSIMTPLIPKVHRMISSDPWKPEYDFTNEFYGWDELGPMIVQLKQKYQSANPIIASHRYETTAQTMLSITRAGMTDRVWMLNTTRSHYTVMQTAGEIDQLKGRDALFVVTNKYFVDPKAYAQFDQCEPNELKTYRGSELARVFTVFYCKNFQGII
jgi:dolichol-phosphate mannosyltransferase